MSANVNNKGSGENVTPEVQAQTPLITEIMESLIGKVTLANATSETILEGYNAYVGQELVKGTLRVVDLLSVFGLTKINSGTLLNTSNTVININHNLEAIPKFFMLFAVNYNGAPAAASTLISMIYAPDSPYIYSNQVGTAAIQTSNWSASCILLSSKLTVTADAVRVTEPSYVMQANVKYVWIAMA